MIKSHYATNLCGYIKRQVYKHKKEEFIVPFVRADLLSILTKYFKHHRGKPRKPVDDFPLKKDMKEYLDNWDYEFIQKFNQKQLVHVLLVAKLLSIDALVRLCCFRFAFDLRESGDIGFTFSGKKTSSPSVWEEGLKSP